MIFRAATHQDAAALAALHRAARTTAMPWLPVLHTPAQDTAFFARHVIGQHSVLIAQSDDTPTGFIAFDTRQIDHLYVAPTHWGCGIGTALLTQAQSNARRLELWTFQQNTAARAFYTAHGFLEVAQTDGAGNEEHFPDVRMVWKFWA